MHIESKEELITLLELIGYVEDTDVPPMWRPTMVDKFKRRPAVLLLWINGCQIKGVIGFLTFTKAWQYIGDLNVK